MKKITAILKDCKLVDKLFLIRERQIFGALNSAKTAVEEKIAKAQIEYDNKLKELSEKDADYKGIINSILEAKMIELNGASTLKALEAIEADLNSEAETEEDSEAVRVK